MPRVAKVDWKKMSPPTRVRVAVDVALETRRRVGQAAREERGRRESESAVPEEDEVLSGACARRKEIQEAVTVEIVDHDVDPALWHDHARADRHRRAVAARRPRSEQLDP